MNFEKAVDFTFRRVKKAIGATLVLFQHPLNFRTAVLLRDMVVYLVHARSVHPLGVVVVLQKQVDPYPGPKFFLEPIDYFPRREILVNKRLWTYAATLSRLSRLDEFPRQQRLLIDIEDLDGTFLF